MVYRRSDLCRVLSSNVFRTVRTHLSLPSERRVGRPLYDIIPTNPKCVVRRRKQSR